MPAYTSFFMNAAPTVAVVFAAESTQSNTVNTNAQLTWEKSSDVCIHERGFADACALVNDASDCKLFAPVVPRTTIFVSRTLISSFSDTVGERVQSAVCEVRLLVQTGDLMTTSLSARFVQFLQAT